MGSTKMKLGRKMASVVRRRRKFTRVVTAAVLAASVLVLPAVAGSTPASAAGSPCGATINPVTCENQQTGTAQSVWDVPGNGDSTIQGFSTNISVNVGTTVSFKIQTDASAYSIDIYRLGYYQGNGARKVASITPSAHLPQVQPTCLTDPSVSLVDCGNWAVSASWAVPSTAVSGVYLAHLTRTDTGGASLIPFIVRNDASTSAIVYQTSDPTWEAYNRYGDADFYTGSTTNLWDSASRAREISYNRPFATRGDDSGRDYLFSDEYPTIRYLERNGYDVSYISGVDTDRIGATVLKNHKVFLSVGHDEYWSQAQRTNVENARNAGVNLMFLSGNEVFWHTRYAASIDGSNTAYRTLIDYKETWDNAPTDPSGEATATWRDPRFSAAPGGSSPENALTGVMYMSNNSDMPLTVTAAQGKTRLWRNTGLSSMSGSSTDVAQNIVGYESDEDLDNGFRPTGEIDLSTSTGTTDAESIDFGHLTGPGTTTHHITLYKASSGAIVFGAGTIDWAWGLDDAHDGTQQAASTAMQQAMVNLFADMGVQPQTLMSGLVAASASTDTTAPTSKITSPLAGASIPNGTNLTVSGTATDVGGVVAGVEVSIDGGTTWHPATGTTSWTYTGVVHGSATLSILSRATDDSLNTEKPSAGVSITTSCPCSLFGQSTPKTVDSGDPSAVETGIRFSPTTSGYVTGIRFYKSSANVGTHTGSLWTSTGTLLAKGTFTNETASGWQTLTFSSPLAVTAGTTYVASYFSPSGHYSDDPNFFYYKDYSASPLTAQSNSPTDATKFNGVYTGGDNFPNKLYQGDNYYVDVTFTSAANGGPGVTATTPSAGATAVSTTAPITATFSAPVNPASIAFTVSSLGGSVAGTVSYNAASQTATFMPSAALATGTFYTASVSATGTNGIAMVLPSTWQFTTAGPASCPCTLFSATSAPVTPDSGDRSGYTLGVQFSSSTAGSITGVRFYKSANNTGVHTGSLWSATGTLLAKGTFSGESLSGWQTLLFSTPISITANTTYVVGYFAPAGHESEDDHFFDVPLTSGPLTAPVGAGVYRSGTDGFPSLAFANANYWVDPIFSTGAGTPPPAAPTVTSTSPADGTTGVATSVAPSAVFDSPVTPASIAFTVSSLASTIGGTTTYNAATQTATFTPSAALPTGTTFTVSVTATGTNGLTMAAPATWSFSTTGPPTCPCTLFANAVPSTVDSGDAHALSLGTQFTPSSSGWVSGVRFYKATSNAGSHTGTLWTSDGTLLATTTFSGETASGWQTASFSTPVAVTAGTTYVVSYFTPTGHYSENDHYFDSSVTIGPLTAPIGAGLYVYGSDTFPTSTFANANYWVDPVFVTTLAVPPTVTATTPASGATGVAATAKPTATFSAPVTASTVAFTVTGPGGAVAGSVTYDSPSQTATFTPSAALAGNTTYTASATATGTNGAAMTSPSTWSFTTADTTPPTVSAVTAAETGTSATVTWTTNENATSRVDYGTSSASLTLNATTAGLSTSHSVTLNGLVANTRYYYRVTSADGAGNTTVSPAPPGAPNTFAPTIAPLADTLTTDFSAGTANSTYVSANGDGEVVLAPSTVAEFTGTALPAGVTSSAVVTGGKTTVANGVAVVSGANLTTTATFANPKSLETLATLGQNQKIGWVTSSNSSVAMAFSVNSANQLVATVDDGVFNNASSVLASGWTATPHTYRIEWTSSAATFYVDGVQKYTHAFTSWFSNTYRPQFTDSLTTDAGLTVDWMRLGPYAASGTFTSRVLDAQAAVTWDGLSWDATVPTGTTLVVTVRTGNTPTPGAGWSTFKTIAASGGAIGTTARYLQYQLSFTSTGSRFTSAAVRSVSAGAHV
jgi:hypothetical protein